MALMPHYTDNLQDDDNLAKIPLEVKPFNVTWGSDLRRSELEIFIHSPESLAEWVCQI